MAGKARTRKRRRLNSARLRTGKKIVRHRCRSGRTGSAHTKKLKSRGTGQQGRPRDEAEELEP